MPALRTSTNRSSNSQTWSAHQYSTMPPRQPQPGTKRTNILCKGLRLTTNRLENGPDTHIGKCMWPRSVRPAAPMSKTRHEDEPRNNDHAPGRPRLRIGREVVAQVGSRRRPRTTIRRVRVPIALLASRTWHFPSHLHLHQVTTPFFPTVSPPHTSPRASTI